MRKLLSAVLLLCASVCAFGQGATVLFPAAVTQQGNFLPFATITFCSTPTTVNTLGVCQTPVTVFKDQALTLPYSSAILTDGIGFFPPNAVTATSLWFTPGTYCYTLTVSSMTSPATNPCTPFTVSFTASSGSLTVPGNITQTQPTAATNIANQSSFFDCMNASYWTGAISATDQWCFQSVLGAGANPTTTFTLTHGGSPGSSGVATFSVPALAVAGAETSQSDNQVFQANKSTGISGAGSVGVPYSGASGQGGIGESIAAMGAANGSPGILHIPAGYYNVTTTINATANINTPYANSSPPAPLTIEGDGQASTFIIGNTGGKVFDETGRRIILKNLTILGGTSSQSTLGVYMARGTGLVSQFCDGEIIENVSIDLASVPAANGGQDTIGVYNNACEDYNFNLNIVSAHQPYIITSNNVFGITSSYQTIAVNLHNFDSQGRIIGGSVTTYGNGVASGQDIMLQGHASNTTIMNVSGECDGPSPSKVFLYIKAPSAPDAATDPLPGLHVSGMQYECPTGGMAILNEQVLTNAFIQGNVANVAATPIIQLATVNGMLRDSMVSIQVGNAGLTEPMVSDAGAATSGLQGGQIFLPATSTIALTNAASTCFGTNITATYSSPSITCGGFANQDLNGIISTFNSWKLLNTGGITIGSDTSHTFNVQGALAFSLDTTLATFGDTPVPSTAGGKNLGTTALPFGNIFLGTAATNNFKFQPAATSGARIITMADPLSPTTVALPMTIGSGTAVMTTAGIATGACGSTVTVGATGVLTTDTIDFARNAAATIGNGGGLTLNAWPTAGNVNFNYCNSAAGTITPTAMTVNWSVRRP